MSTHSRYRPKIATAACSRIDFPARQSTSGCRHTVRPTANPINPHAKSFPRLAGRPEILDRVNHQIRAQPGSHRPACRRVSCPIVLLPPAPEVRTKKTLARVGRSWSNGWICGSQSHPCDITQLPSACGNAGSDCWLNCRARAWVPMRSPVAGQCAERAPCQVRRPIGRSCRSARSRPA